MQWFPIPHSKTHGGKSFPSFLSHNAQNFLHGYGYDDTKKLGSQALAKFLSVAQSFWFRRNKWVHEQVLGHPSVAMEHGLAILDHFQESKRGDHINGPTGGTWRCPMVNYLKLNVNGVVFVDQRRAGIGMEVRNDQGQFCFGASLTTPEFPEPEEISNFWLFYIEVFSCVQCKKSQKFRSKVTVS